MQYFGKLVRLSLPTHLSNYTLGLEPALGVESSHTCNYWSKVLVDESIKHASLLFYSINSHRKRYVVRANGRGFKFPFLSWENVIQLFAHVIYKCSL